MFFGLGGVKFGGVEKLNLVCLGRSGRANREGALILCSLWRYLTSRRGALTWQGLLFPCCRGVFVFDNLLHVVHVFLEGGTRRWAPDVVFVL